MSQNALGKNNNLNIHSLTIEFNEQKLNHTFGVKMIRSKTKAQREYESKRKKNLIIMKKRNDTFCLHR